MINKTFAKFSLTAISLAFASSCMKAPDLKADFGPEVSNQELAKLLSEVETPDPYTIKAGEYAYFTRSTNIADQIYQIDQRWAYTITSKTEEANDYVFKYVKDLREYIDGHEKPSSYQHTVRLEKKPTNSISSMTPTEFAKTFHQSAALDPIMTLGALNTNGSSIRPAGKRVTFHNAKLQKGHVPVPDFVQNCGRLPSDKCRGALKAFTLSFDQVVWDGDQGQKYSVSWLFSPDVPFFGSTMFPDPPGVIQSCSSTQLPYQGQRIKVTQCDEIKDFTFGAD